MQTAAAVFAAIIVGFGSGFLFGVSYERSSQGAAAPYPDPSSIVPSPAPSPPVADPCRAYDDRCIRAQAGGSQTDWVICARIGMERFGEPRTPADCAAWLAMMARAEREGLRSLAPAGGAAGSSPTP